MAETMTETQIAKKVSFTVAECGEFHDMGEFHENIGSAKEALEIFKQIPGDRMNAIPTIGIRLTDVLPVTLPALPSQSRSSISICPSCIRSKTILSESVTIRK